MIAIRNAGLTKKIDVIKTFDRLNECFEKLNFNIERKIEQFFN